MPITGWNLTVEEWTQGAEIFREDTQFGLVNREHTYATNKNNINVFLNKMTTWNNISGIGRGVSGRGFYEAKFNWDGTADGAYLDFGELLNSMKVTVNGVQTADVNMNAPVLDIGKYLVIGENTIELEYSSTLTNEMLELGRISAGGNSSGSPAWGGYYKDYRAYGPSQAVVIPYVNTEIEQSVTDVTLSLTGTEHAHVTDNVSYTLSAAGMVRLATMLVEVDLDEVLLTNPVAAPVGDWYIITQLWKDGKLLVVVGNNEGAVGEGDILTITAAPTGQAGEAAASVTYAEMGAYDGEGEVLVTALYEDATCTTVLTSYDIFDVNKDGIVNLLDVTRAQRFYGLYDADSDVDKDGKITVNDLILIINNYSDLFD